MSQYPKPYECSECSAYPDSAFSIFTATNDWIISFPELRLFHLHFGDVAWPDEQDTEQAEFVADYYYHRIHEHPNLSFFFVLDMTKIDNSASVSDRAKQIYWILLEHPQLVSGVVYGATTDMQAMIHELTEETGKNVATVKTKQEADQVYQDWHRGQ